MRSAVARRAPVFGHAIRRFATRVWFIAGVLLIGLPILSKTAAAVPANTVYVFAAASTTPPMDEIASQFAKMNAIKIIPVFAASGTLARQIAAGAPADIYLSANPEWMAWLVRQDLIESQGPKALIGNCLVVVQPASDATPIRLRKDLPAQLGDRRLALADPALAPVGAYAKSALQSLKLWRAVKRRIAYQPNARAALALVQRGEVAAAILYRSDALVSRKVRISEVIPPTHAPEIQYPAAILKGHDRSAVRLFFEFLRSDRARGIFLRHGFVAPGQPCSS